MKFSNWQLGIKKSRNSLKISSFYTSGPSHWFGITNSADHTPEQISEGKHGAGYRGGFTKKAWSRRPLLFPPPPHKTCRSLHSNPKMCLEGSVGAEESKHSSFSETGVPSWALVRPLGSLYPQETDFCHWMSSSLMPPRLRTKKNWTIELVKKDIHRWMNDHNINHRQRSMQRDAQLSVNRWAEIIFLIRTCMQRGNTLYFSTPTPNRLWYPYRWDNSLNPEHGLMAAGHGVFISPCAEVGELSTRGSSYMKP